MQRRIQLRLNFTIRQREAVNRQAHVVITKASRFRVSLRVPSWPWWLTLSQFEPLPKIQG